MKCSVWVETDTGCGFGQKQVATYTMIHPQDTQTEKQKTVEKSTVCRKLGQYLDMMWEMTKVCALGSGILCEGDVYEC